MQNPLKINLSGSLNLVGSLNVYIILQVGRGGGELTKIYPEGVCEKFRKSVQFGGGHDPVDFISK
jgi:hypothetical protein